MTGEKLSQLGEVLNRLTEVEWDRCHVDEHSAWVFGWIARDDGRFDFAVVVAETSDEEDGIRAGCSTSSALYSKEYSRRISGEDAVHYDCERVEHIFGDLVERKISLLEVVTP